EIDATDVQDEGQYDHDQAVFCDISMKMPASQGGDDAYIRATIINGQSIVMGLYSLDGSEIDQTMLDEFNTITDSIYFTQVLSPSGGVTSNGGADAPDNDNITAESSSASWVMAIVLILAVALVV